MKTGFHLNTCLLCRWFVCLLGFLVSLKVGMILVGEHGLDVAPDEGQEDGHSETGGHQVEQGGLGVLVDVHHEDGQQQAGKVR